MTEPRDEAAGPFTVSRIAELVGGIVEGDPDLELRDVRPLAEAGPEHLAFLSNRKYYRQLATTRAGCVLLDRDTASDGRTVVRCDNPYRAFALSLSLFHPQWWPEPRLDPRASVASDALVDGTTIEAFAYVGSGARIGAGSWIEAGAYVGACAEIGEDCRLMPNSVVAPGCSLGARVWLNPGAVVGGEGFGFAPTPGGHVKIPQAGRAVLEDDVELGSNSCVDRSTMGETRVRRGTKVDNLVQIGHGSEIGEDCFLAAYTGIAGSSYLGRGVVMAGRTGVANHVRVGDGVQVAAGGIIMHDQPAGARVAGVPAFDHRQWLRAVTAFSRLPNLVRRVRALEERLAELEKGDE